MRTPRRCVLLFKRTTAREAETKGLTGGRNLFQYVERRIAAAVADLNDVDLVVVGADRVRGAHHRLTQRGATFGARLEAAFEDTRALGYDHIVAVGIDTPELSHTDFQDAFDALATNAVVLGPSTDGGVYLIGLARRVRLADVRWQTESVFHDLVRVLPLATVLRLLHDIDDRRDALTVAHQANVPVLLRALCRGAAQLSGPPEAARFTGLARRPRRAFRIRGPPIV